MTAAAKTYHDQCHCGAVRFSARTGLDGMGDCNCSRCRRLGWVMQSVPATDFVLESGADNLTEYRFNTQTIAHLFCQTCGIESFARGSDSKGHELAMINVNCLEDAPIVDHAAITHWDGANW
ncbi:MAG: GFA family protein [Candidatus Devosia euplotis]|nr:GFA family protein [Candidatus Devosia euplotis]